MPVCQNWGGDLQKKCRKNAKKCKKNGTNYSENWVAGSGRAGSGHEQAKGITKLALSPLIRTKDFFFYTSIIIKSRSPCGNKKCYKKCYRKCYKSAIKYAIKCAMKIPIESATSSTGHGLEPVFCPENPRAGSNC